MTTESLRVLFQFGLEAPLRSLLVLLRIWSGKTYNFRDRLCCLIAKQS